MNETQRAIMSLARASSFVEADHVAYSLHITVNYARKILKALTDANVLSRTRRGQRYRYTYNDRAKYCPHCGGRL